MSDRVAVEMTVAAPAAAVWRALRDPDPAAPLGLDGLADLAAGERYATTTPTGERLAGTVWFRSEHQLGLTVDAWGDGLLAVSTAPGGGRRC